MLLNTIQDTGQPRKEELEKVPAGRAGTSGTSPKAGLESKMGEVGGVGGVDHHRMGLCGCCLPSQTPSPPPRMVSGSR